MHATLHQLLILRDQVMPDSAVAAHVQDCAECSAELQRLQSVTVGLRGLSARWTPPDRWPAIQRALFEQRAGRAPERERRWPGWLLPAASAAVVVIAVVVTLSMQRDADAPMHVARTAEESAGLSRATEQSAQQQQLLASEQDQHSLVAESQRLEEMLTALPDEPRVTRAQTALTVADLEDQIRWVDYRLNIGAESGLEPRQSRSLWQERVDLLNSLVAVRYAESNALAF